MSDEQKYVKRWEVDIVESERGWGSKVDDTRRFKTEEEAETFISEFNAENTSETVPDWYMYACGPREVFVVDSDHESTQETVNVEIKLETSEGVYSTHHVEVPTDGLNDLDDYVASRLMEY